MAITVLLVDDHEIVRSGFERLLNRTDDITVVAEASNGVEAIEQYKVFHPDITIMDISMPLMGGVEAIEQIKNLDSKARIIVFSMHENITMIHRLYAIGVKGYVTKGEAPHSLIDAIRIVNKGEIYIDKNIAQHLIEHDISGEEHPAEVLTAREYLIFKMIAEGETNQTISEKLSLNLKTVNFYIAEIKKKLNLSTSAEITYLALRLGIVEP